LVVDADVGANGLDIYYELHGAGEPLVLIGGLGADSTFFVELLFRSPDLAQSCGFALQRAPSNTAKCCGGDASVMHSQCCRRRQCKRPVPYRPALWLRS
jgi:hypothetical protein